jgi:hypothetical protein
MEFDAVVFYGRLGEQASADLEKTMAIQAASNETLELERSEPWA